MRLVDLVPESRVAAAALAEEAASIYDRLGAGCHAKLVRDIAARAVVTEPKA